MRGLRKSWPPRNVSPKDQLPRTLRQAEEEMLLALRGVPEGTPEAARCARALFDSLNKESLREVLAQDQGGLCVYCERRLEDEQAIPPIEHWRPLSGSPALALRWENLYLSCATPTTCDGRKDDVPLQARPGEPELPWPTELDYSRCVGFTSLGEAYVRADAPLDEGQRRALSRALGVPHDDQVKDNGILNLNHPKLVAARKGVLDSEKLRLERAFQGRRASREDRAAHAKSLRSQPALQKFISIRLGWLERQLGKGR